jgi:hypothetical protein
MTQLLFLAMATHIRVERLHCTTALLSYAHASAVSRGEYDESLPGPGVCTLILVQW